MVRSSIATILTLFVCGVWAFLDAPRIAANLPTPWVGVRERINIYGYMLWMLMLAATLLLTEDPNSKLNRAGRDDRTIHTGLAADGRLGDAPPGSTSQIGYVDDES